MYIIFSLRIELKKFFKFIKESKILINEEKEW